jgi:CxxC-x17-CxxC domain-containing protein
MDFIDKDLKCTSCGAEFVFSAGEQKFFRDKGFTNTPKRCRTGRLRVGGSVRVRTNSRVNCADCGMETTVPFKPKQDRPVYCAECFNKRKNDQHP